MPERKRPAYRPNAVKQETPPGAVVRVHGTPYHARPAVGTPGYELEHGPETEQVQEADDA